MPAIRQSCVTRQFLIPITLGVVCGVILVGHFNDRWRKAHPPTVHVDLRSIVVVVAQWPQTLAQMSAEFKPNCKDIRKIRMLFAVMSTPTHNGFMLRELARNTIYKDLAEAITVKFVVATMGLAGNVLSDLRKEQSKFGDLVMLSDHKDEYNQLPRKVQLTILWANKYELEFDYFIKTDDDVVVRLDNMLNALKDFGCPRNLYWGRYLFHNYVDYTQTGYWRDLTWFFCETYLPYGAGVGYVMGRQVLQVIAKYADHYRHSRLEDATMGLWMSPYNLTIKDDRDRFVLNPSCYNGIICTHQRSYSRFKVTTNSLSKTGSMC